MSTDTDPRPRLAAPLLSHGLLSRVVKAANDAASTSQATVSVAVVDAAGRLMFFSRGEDCSHISFETARGKAAAAAGFRLPTQEMALGSAARAAFWASVSEKLDVVLAPGGHPLVIDGVLVGGIGCGGGHGDLDERCALAGTRALAVTL